MHKQCIVYIYIYIYISLQGEGMDDIKYNFLIGQDGVIYEGRGWGVAGPQIDHLNAVSVGELLKLQIIY